MAYGRVNVGSKTIEEYGLFEINPNIKRELVDIKSLSELTGMTGLSAMNIRSVGRQRNYWTVQPSVAGVYNWQIIKYDTKTKTLKHDGEIPGTKHISSEFHYPDVVAQDSDFIYIRPEGVGYNVRTKKRYYLTKNNEDKEIQKYVDTTGLNGGSYVNDSVIMQGLDGYYKNGKKIAGNFTHEISRGTRCYGSDYAYAETFIRSHATYATLINFNTGEEYFISKDVSDVFFGVESYAYFDNDNSTVIYPNEERNQFEIYKYYRVPIEE